MEIVMLKMADGSFVPMTTYDKSLASGLPTGQAIKVKVKRVKDRSYQFHKLYFGGLLELAADYFEPVGGLVQEGERKTLRGLNRYADAVAGCRQDSLRLLCKSYIQNVQSQRAEKVAQPEMKPHEVIDLLHEWVKKEAGLYDLFIVPNGIEKKVRSISFDKMTDVEFEQYFKKAYDVIWRFILSKKFPTQNDYDNALNQLMSMN